MSRLSVFCLLLLSACPAPEPDPHAGGHNPGDCPDHCRHAVEPPTPFADAGSAPADAGSLSLDAAGQAETDSGPLDAGPPADTGQPDDACPQGAEYSELHRRCRPVVGPQTPCGEGSFRTDHPWGQGEDLVRRFVALDGTGSGRSEEQPAPDLATAFNDLPETGEIVVFYGGGTFDEAIELDLPDRELTLIGLCPEETLLDAGDEMTLVASNLARLRLAAIAFDSNFWGYAWNQYQTATVLLSRVGEIELDEVKIEARRGSGLQATHTGAGGLAITRSEFGFNAVMNTYIHAIEGPIHVSGTHLRGPAWGPLLDFIRTESTVEIRNNLFGGSNYGAIAVLPCSALNDACGPTQTPWIRIEHNELIGPIIQEGIMLSPAPNQGPFPGQVGTDVFIRHNRFEQIDGMAIDISHFDGELIIEDNDFLGPIDTRAVQVASRSTAIPVQLRRNEVRTVMGSAFWLNDIAGPVVVEGNDLKGPIEDHGIVMSGLSGQAWAGIRHNRMEEVGGYGVKLINSRVSVSIQDNELVGPLGGGGVHVWHRTRTRPSRRQGRAELRIERNTVGDVSLEDAIKIENSSHWVSIADNRIDGPIIGSGIRIEGGYPTGAIMGNTMGRVYQLGVYIGPPSVDDLLNSPTGAWRIQNNTLLGPIGLDGISIYNASAEDREFSVEDNRIGRAFRLGISVFQADSPVAIRNNTLLGPIGHDGIYISNGTEGGVISGNEIHSGHSSGLSIHGSDTGGEWSISGNFIRDVDGRGMVFYDLRDDVGINVTNNEVIGARGAAAYAYACTGPLVFDSNVFSDTRQAGYIDALGGMEMILFGYGVSALDVADLSITNNLSQRNHIGGFAVDHAQWGSDANHGHLEGSVQVHMEGNELSGHPRHRRLETRQDVVIQNRAAGMQLTGFDAQGAMNPVGLEVPMCRNAGEAHAAAVDGRP